MDLSKAFDAIDHSILLHKLHNYGVRGTMLDWFKSYLSGRSQFVSLDGANSDLLSLTTGVPQGSVLGPHLLLIFINDIGFIPNLKYKPKLFADDTNIFVNGTSPADLQFKCQNVLNVLSDWLLANKLSVNYDKTHYMIFSPPHQLDSNLKLNLCMINFFYRKSSFYQISWRYP